MPASDSRDIGNVQLEGNNESDVVTNDFGNLDEIAAPPPEQNPEELSWRRRTSVEERRSKQQMNQGWSVNRSTTKSQRTESLQTLLYTISYLVLFSILGTLARLGLQALTYYPNAVVVNSELWANVGGSFVLGFLQEEQWLSSSYRIRIAQNEHKRTTGQYNLSDLEKVGEEIPREPDMVQTVQNIPLAVKKNLPLYIGLSVGFCGSFTSFSSFIRDAFLAMSNDLSMKGAAPARRNAAYSLPAFLAVLITEIGLSLCGLSAGAHVAIAMNPVLSRIPSIKVQLFENLVVVVLCFGCWLGAVFMAIWPPHQAWRGEVVFALVFAPMGCLIRFLLALKMNKINARFPWGTFAANVSGSVVLAICWDLQRAQLGAAAGSSIGGGLVGCQVLQGVQDGFCGCLTTVSTWVAELKGLKRKHAYFYGLMSVVSAFSLVVVIMGSLRWTDGYKGVCKL